MKRTRSQRADRRKPFTKLFSKVQMAVKLAEEIFGEGTGEQKRTWVINTLNKHIDIPLLPENTEALILGLLIDLVVDQLNSMGELDGPRDP
jgi:ABC-type iron transport system FetAB ATPase subunit